LGKRRIAEGTSPRRFTENVAPIQTPGGEPSIGKVRTIEERVNSEIERLFQAQAIVDLANRGIRAISADKDVVAIVQETSTLSFALDGAYKLMGEVAEQMSCIAGDAAKEAK
jgi:hypothetical protein